MFSETQDPPPTADDWTELKYENVDRVKSFTRTIHIGSNIPGYGGMLKYFFTRVIPDEGIIEYKHCSGKHWLAFRPVSNARFLASFTENEHTVEFRMRTEVGDPTRETSFSVSIAKPIAAPIRGSDLLLRIRSILASHCFEYSDNSTILVEMDGGSLLRAQSVLWREGGKRLHACVVHVMLL